MGLFLCQMLDNWSNSGDATVAAADGLALDASAPRAAAAAEGILLVEQPSDGGGAIGDARPMDADPAADGEPVAQVRAATDSLSRFSGTAANLATYYAALIMGGWIDLSTMEIANDCPFAFSGSIDKFNLHNPEDPDGFNDRLLEAINGSNLGLIKKAGLEQLLPSFQEFVAQGIHQHSDRIMQYVDGLIDTVAEADDPAEATASVIKLVNGLFTELIPEFQGVFHSDVGQADIDSLATAALMIASEHTDDKETLLQLEQDIKGARSLEEAKVMVRQSTGQLFGDDTGAIADRIIDMFNRAHIGSPFQAEQVAAVKILKEMAKAADVADGAIDYEALLEIDDPAQFEQAKSDAINNNGINVVQFGAKLRTELRMIDAYRMKTQAKTHNISDKDQLEMMEQARERVKEQFYAGYNSYDEMIEAKVINIMTTRATNGEIFINDTTIRAELREDIKQIDFDFEVSKAYQEIFTEAVLTRKSEMYAKLCTALYEKFFGESISFVTPTLQKAKEVWLSFGENDTNFAVIFLKRAVGTLVALLALLFYGTFGNMANGTINLVVKFILKRNLVTIIGAILHGTTDSIVKSNGFKKSLYNGLNGLLGQELGIDLGSGAEAEEAPAAAVDDQPEIADAVDGDADVNELEQMMRGLLNIYSGAGHEGTRHGFVEDALLKAVPTVATCVRKVLRNGEMMKGAKMGALDVVSSAFDQFNAPVVEDGGQEDADVLAAEAKFYDQTLSSVIGQAADEAVGSLEIAGGWRISDVPLLGRVARATASGAARAATSGYVHDYVREGISFALNPRTIEAIMHRGIGTLADHVSAENLERRQAIEARRRERMKHRTFHRVGMGPSGGAVLIAT